jgi:D-alanyl-D-alanine carboxypeptidase (penicillin-binding protein 5/6)
MRPALRITTYIPCSAGRTFRTSFEEGRLTKRRQHTWQSTPKAQIATAFCFAFLLIARLAGSASAQEVPDLQIHSTAYIVIDADSGEIFAQKNAHDHRAMASLTKVFTATEALHRAALDRQITTEASDVFDDSSTRVGFGAGETFSMEDLLYGMLLPSGNDAAHAIARDLGTEPGDSADAGYDRFISWMNERIKRMGLADTNLVNAHGWGVPNHYSSAYDLATFMRYAVQSPEFLNVISTSNYTTANGYSFGNTNKLLNTYGDLIGGKTGYDDDAGYCLIEVAQRDGNTMISVTLDGVAPDDWYDDNRVLLDYAFDQKSARGGQIEGEVAAYNNPDVALLSSASSAGGVFGTGVQVAAQPGSTTETKDVASQPVPPDQSAESSEVAATASGKGLPGFELSLVLALLIAFGFAFLRGRDLFLHAQTKVPPAAPVDSKPTPVTEPAVVTKEPASEIISTPITNET